MAERVSDAIQGGWTKALIDLLDDGFAPTTPVSHYGRPVMPVELAIAYGEGAMISILVNAGADPNGVCLRDGLPYLHTLTENYDEAQAIKIGRILLDLGADPSVEVGDCRWNAADMANRAKMYKLERVYRNAFLVKPVRRPS